MTDDRDSLHKLEDPMMELGTLYRSLETMAVTTDEDSPLKVVLYSIAHHLEHIYDALYGHYEHALTIAHEEQRSKLEVVDNGRKP